MFEVDQMDLDLIEELAKQNRVEIEIQIHS